MLPPERLAAFAQATFSLKTLTPERLAASPTATDLLKATPPERLAFPSRPPRCSRHRRQNASPPPPGQRFGQDTAGPSRSLPAGTRFGQDTANGTPRSLPPIALLHSLQPERLAAFPQATVLLKVLPPERLAAFPQATVLLKMLPPERLAASPQATVCSRG